MDSTDAVDETYILTNESWVVGCNNIMERTKCKCKRTKTIKWPLNVCCQVYSKLMVLGTLFQYTFYC